MTVQLFIEVQFLVNFLVFTAPVLRLFAYASYERAERKRWDVRAILMIMAIAATTAVVAEVVDIITEANGTTGTILDVVSGTAGLVVLAPFIIFPLARLVGRCRKGPGCPVRARGMALVGPNKSIHEVGVTALR